MSSCELCFRAKNFLSLVLSFISPFPLSISFSLQVPKISLISFHSIPFHFIPFLFHLISIPFRFPSGCHSRRGRISNFNFHPAATSGAILTTLSTLRPCSVASSYKGLPPRVMCAHRRELVFVHTSLSRPVGDVLVIREDTLDEWFPASYLAVRSASHLVIPGACDWSVPPLASSSFGSG